MGKRQHRHKTSRFVTGGVRHPCRRTRSPQGNRSSFRERTSVRKTWRAQSGAKDQHTPMGRPPSRGRVKNLQRHGRSVRLAVPHGNLPNEDFFRRPAGISEGEYRASMKVGQGASEKTKGSEQGRFSEIHLLSATVQALLLRGTWRFIRIFGSPCPGALWKWARGHRPYGYAPACAVRDLPRSGAPDPPDLRPQPPASFPRSLLRVFIKGKKGQCRAALFSLKKDRAECFRAENVVVGGVL